MSIGYLAQARMALKKSFRFVRLGTALGLFASCIFLGGPFSARAANSDTEREGAAISASPVAAGEILEIIPFSLGEAYRFDWSEARPMVKSGFLVVLKFDPKILVPRETAEPVLYAGEGTVQRLSRGDGSGFVIGIVPGDTDLSRAPIWLGRPFLPERVSPDIIRSERALADEKGISAFSGDRIESVTHDRVEAADLSELLRTQAAELVIKYSPDEKGLADTWRLPTENK
jgi:hypothetical protein